MELLRELLDKPLPYNVSKSRDGYEAKFEYKGHTYIIDAFFEPGGDWIKNRIENLGGSTRGMSPEWFDDNENFINLTFYSEDDEDDVATDDDYKMTNRGDAVKILSTVAAFTKQLISSGETRVLFSADDESGARSRVYLKMIQRGGGAKNIAEVRVMSRDETEFYIDF